MTLDLHTLSASDSQHYLQHIIAPRPICFASTVDSAGNVNLSPFSFFNLFSTNPPVVVFSPSRRVRNNTTKHTLENVLEVPEVAISMVDYAMVQQVSLASCEYAQGVNEFTKAGFTMEASTLIQPPMVKESKAKMECRILEIKPLGNEGGAGNLVICEVLRLHIDDSILDEHKKVDQRKINHVARLGGDWYCKIDDTNLFIVPKPNTKLGIGIDALPAPIRNSKVLTGNDLGMLANVDQLPEKNGTSNDPVLKELLSNNKNNEAIHLYAASLLRQNKIDEAWQVLLAL